MMEVPYREVLNGIRRSTSKRAKLLDVLKRLKMQQRVRYMRSRKFVAENP